ncbi:hypothetical protein NKH63_26080 [Mesorhizobium sp. M0960]|uniref:hypothetical protein n=1 Tax=Mesorhizobium sp. M0960 TaxID=2957035 RepID=UPI0033366685
MENTGYPLGFEGNAAQRRAFMPLPASSISKPDFAQFVHHELNPCTIILKAARQVASSIGVLTAIRVLIRSYDHKLRTGETPNVSLLPAAYMRSSQNFASLLHFANQNLRKPAKQAGYLR